MFLLMRRSEEKYLLDQKLNLIEFLDQGWMIFWIFYNQYNRVQDAFLYDPSRKEMTYSTEHLIVDPECEEIIIL